jgi:polyribonucleotide nucleotidyltransferase
MFTVFRKQMDWAGRPLTIETGRVARQADGSVMVTYGETVVLATVCFEKKAKEGLDFFPLTVNYQEKFYAGGRIPGGFFKREGRPTEKETLTSRLIDRPIRPLFVKGFKNETQVICTLLSSDGQNDADIVGLVAASAALTLSGVPFMGPIGGARVGYIDGEYVLNPTNDERTDSALDMVVAGTREGVLMVESEAHELTEEVMLGAVTYAHKHFQPIIDAIIELAEAAAKPGFEFTPVDTDDMEKQIADAFGKDIEKAYAIKEKMERRSLLDALKQKAIEQFGGAEGEHANMVKGVFKEAEARVLRGAVLKTGKRIDGRDTRTVRPIVCEIDLLPSAHGSAMFTRGETQAIVVATLGSGRDEQIIDSVEGEFKDRFMLHYNFPPFSVGEVGRMGGPGRREIGHGRLARRAIEGMLPPKEQFPYTIRVVSEITESNGSSSMATVCGTSMALMAAGVPMPRPVAGIAMGLVKEGKDFTVLTDILGDEDHLGDMDFKVAGTDKGITALQMDIKITSITEAIMKQALEQAHEGRIHILGKMTSAIAESRAEVSEKAPGMVSFKIDKEKIREVIGTGGKIIRSLQEETGCTVDIQDDGTVSVSGVNRTSLKECVSRIQGIVAMPEVGKMYTGPVTRVTDFGAFIRILPSHEGLLHISEIVPVRLGQVEDVLQEGETVTVKCVNLEDNGKIRLTMKDIAQTADIQARVDAVVDAGGTQPTAETLAARERKEERGSRDRGRGGPRRRSA